MRCFPEANLSVATDFAMAIQTRSLKKVDSEEEKKRREQSQQNRSKFISVFLIV